MLGQGPSLWSLGFVSKPCPLISFQPSPGTGIVHKVGLGDGSLNTNLMPSLMAHTHCIGLGMGQGQGLGWTD